ncbi:hypothetical protein CEUSTIGMA_g2052.t1 [Chlamydomonas eustigma]|uniref:Uncharacterized protein n=1 Tax=Chlamydomonas eustigma TaxID=1157962 RepID=A0A250WUU1_9CHLO|nr:hypothetical protein CEUSTIGMA_g2052.t1 [Chlamydomonas eustigma]|eukprot:GAX74604.1 hypothetical protein CEUSTIGMA_g2052.t1 [Chlamydomonas eustigma]
MSMEIKTGKYSGKPKLASIESITVRHRIVFLVIKEGFVSLVTLVTKLAKVLTRQLLKMLLYGWRQKTSILLPLSLAPKIVYGAIAAALSSKLGKAVVAVATSLCCMQLHYRRGTTTSINSSVELGFSVLFGMFKVRTQLDLQLCNPFSLWEEGRQGSNNNRVQDHDRSTHNTNTLDPDKAASSNSVLLHASSREREEYRVYLSEDFEQHVMKFLKSQGASSNLSGGACHNILLEGGGGEPDRRPAFIIYSPVKAKEAAGICPVSNAEPLMTPPEIAIQPPDFNEHLGKDTSLFKSLERNRELPLLHYSALNTAALCSAAPLPDGCILDEVYPVPSSTAISSQGSATKQVDMTGNFIISPSSRRIRGSACIDPMTGIDTVRGVMTVRTTPTKQQAAGSSSTGEPDQGGIMLDGTAEGVNTTSARQDGGAWVTTAWWEKPAPRTPPRMSNSLSPAATAAGTSASPSVAVGVKDNKNRHSPTQSSKAVSDV